MREQLTTLRGQLPQKTCYQACKRLSCFILALKPCGGMSYNFIYFIHPVQDSRV